MLFSPLDVDATTGFTRAVRDTFPGGRHLAEHALGGPWHVVVCTHRDEPNWLAQAALEAFPSANVVHHDGWCDAAAATIHLLSDFAYELVMYWSDEYTLSFSELEHTYATAPTAHEELEVVARLLSDEPLTEATAPDADLLEALRAAATTHGSLATVTDLLTGAHQNANLTIAELRDRLRDLAG